MYEKKAFSDDLRLTLGMDWVDAGTVLTLNHSAEHLHGALKP